MKQSLKNVITDDGSEEFVQFARTIDFTALFDQVKALTKADCGFHQPKVTTNHNKVDVTFESEDITEQTGVFAITLERCCVCSFLNGMFKEKDTDEFNYWVCVTIRGEQKGGGRFDLALFTATYRRGKWNFFGPEEQQKNGRDQK